MNKKRDNNIEAELDRKISRLQEDVDKLKKKPKDAWDKVHILSALLVPIAIGFAGFVFSQMTKEAEINIAEKNAKVSQAQLVHSFIEDLTSSGPQKRKIAIEAVLLALPEDGPRLVSIVQNVDLDKDVQEFARGRLAVNEVVKSLRRFRDFRSNIATTEEAQRMLFDAGLREIAIDDKQTVVTAKVDDNFSISIWPGSYSKKNVYGVRYGTKDPNWDWQSTYFEIIISIQRVIQSDHPSRPLMEMVN